MTRNSRLNDRISKIELQIDGNDDNARLIKIAMVRPGHYKPDTHGVVRIESSGHVWHRLDVETEDDFMDRAMVDAVTNAKAGGITHQVVCLGFYGESK